MKIFKHYKLKSSFSIIKDDKAKDRAGVGAGWGTSPHPQILLDQLILIWPNFYISFSFVWFDPTWSNLVSYDPIWFNSIWFELVCSYLIWSDPVWSKLISFNTLWTNLIHFATTGTNLIWFDAIWSNLIQFYLIWIFKSETKHDKWLEA